MSREASVRCPEIEEPLMPFCRFFEIDKAGRIVGAQEQDCKDEEEIRVAASRMLEFGAGRIHGVEAWLGARKVVTVRSEQI
jgi:hypothetical protein